MKLAAYILFLLAACTLFAQNSVTATLRDSSTQEVIPHAHVANISQNLGTTTTLNGNFEIPAFVGDTLVFSAVGYQSLGWVVKVNWFESSPTLLLPQDTVLLNEIVVGELPSEEVFKQRLLNMQLEDSTFWYHGMEEPKPYDNSPLTEQQINNPLFAAFHPTDFLYHKFSRQEKEKRKYHKIIQRENKQARVYRKFTRDWVQNITGLSGDQLTSFIGYCDYSLDYLDKTPLYLIQEDMLAKLERFKKSLEG
ncbi:carboxypeptidase-like regulatory domain-containing protein [Marinoscillum furvescens]|uniref:Carboxypeptidase-like protein n=1 Tax=Marinoscillum furvescens DSM 4134 TaxID=1122208 RepID=A0A3D9KZF9_MARFU|nr:carboxypeptidase-like regulatory domain-containing protein [Marinoscillum furvescens]RED93646.1 carboxypeptidase-like protein [Marinoscillum furvescens DSM 4134]